MPAEAMADDRNGKPQAPPGVPQDHQASADAMASAPADRTVLVVAADPDMRAYVRQCLVHVTAVRVVEASNAATVARAVQSAIPQLVVVDVDGDPGRSSVERLLGRSTALQFVPMIMITDDFHHGDRSGHGPAAILVKPFNARRLCAEVHRLLTPDHS